MVRSPCCDKMGLKKGPWTHEEDEILISYINLYGHGNWRALPKLAGLLRCGKSCRLRWMNYLRPDIKRGNFTREEEETIIKLHEMIGNRWSAIAARLPGRTDNEIKNVWNTHLKKRLKRTQSINPPEEPPPPPPPLGFSIHDRSDATDCSSDVSSLNTGNSDNNDNNNIKEESPDMFSQTNEDFWLEVLPSDNSEVVSDFPMVDVNQRLHNMDFWYNLLNRSEELPDLLPDI